MFNFFKPKKQREDVVVINRRGNDIILPTVTYNGLVKNNVNIILTKSNGKPTCVQLIHKGKYVGTLKNAVGACGFKNGNVCDFAPSNLIFE